MVVAVVGAITTEGIAVEEESSVGNESVEEELDEDVLGVFTEDSWGEI